MASGFYQQRHSTWMRHAQGESHRLALNRLSEDTSKSILPSAQECFGMVVDIQEEQ